MYQLTGSRQCAEEIVQETFRYAVEHQSELYDGPGLRGWLHRVARHQSMHRFRGRSRFKLAIERLFHEPSTAAPDPQEHVAGRQRADRIHRCLQEVSHERREVLALFELQELSMNEIASRLGIAAGTVGSRLTRGRAEFREAWSRA